MLCWQVGWYVTLHVCNVPVSVMESFKEGKPLVLFSLLPHEQKVTKLGSVDSLCVCSSSCDSPDGLERFGLRFPHTACTLKPDLPVVRAA